MLASMLNLKAKASDLFLFLLLSHPSSWHLTFFYLSSFNFGRSFIFEDNPVVLFAHFLSTHRSVHSIDN